MGGGETHTQVDSQNGEMKKHAPAEKIGEIKKTHTHKNTRGKQFARYRVGLFGPINGGKQFARYRVFLNMVISMLKKLSENLKREKALKNIQIIRKNQ